MADSEYKIGFEIVNANRVLRDLKEIQKAHNAEASEVDKTSEAYTRRRMIIEQQRVALKGYNATLKDAKLSSIDLNAALRGEVGALAKVKAEVIKLIKARHEEFELSQKAIASEKRNILQQDRRKKALQKINFELRRQGKTLKDLNLPASTYRKVVQGTAGSLTRVRNAVKRLNNEQKRSVVSTRAATKSLKEYNNQSMFGVRNQRNLNMSFSVFRSKLLLASFAIALVNRSIGKLIGVSADAEEIQNKFNVVFKESASAVRAFSETLGEAVGRSSIKLQEMLATLQDTFVPMGFARDKAADLSKALVKLSVDVASFQNKADDEVLRAFQSAIVGNHEAVRSYGIMLNEATIKAHALEEGIIDTDRELTSQEKILTRVSLLFEMSKDAHGDAENTLMSYSNQLKSFNDNLLDLSKTMGDILKPMAAGVLFVMNSLVDIFDNKTRIKAYAVVFVALGGAFATTAVQANHLRKALVLLNTAVKRAGWLLLIALLAEGAYRLYEWAKGGFEAAEASEEHSKSVDKQAASIKAFLSGMGEYIGSTGIALDSVEKFDAEIERQKGYLKANRDAMNATSAVIRELMKEEETAASLDAAIEKSKLTGQTILGQSYKDTIATLTALRQALIDTNRGYTTDDIEKHAKKYQEQLDILNASSDAEKEKIKLAAQLGTTVDELDKSLIDYIDKIYKEKEAIEAANKSKKDSIKLLSDMKKIREDFYTSLDEMRLSDFEEGVKDLDRKIKLFQDAGLSEIEIQEYVNARMAELSEEDLENERKKFEEKNILYNSFLAGYDEFVNTMVDKDLSGAEKKKRIIIASQDFFIRMLGEMIKEKTKQMIVESVIDKAAKAEQLVTVKAMSVAVAEAWATPALLSAVATGSTSVAAAITSITAGVATTKALATVGAEHGYDGVVNRPTMFLTGEKNKPEHVKVTPLGGSSQRQAAQGATVNLNISGGIVQEDYIRNELIPAINKVAGLGVKINA